VTRRSARRRARVTIWTATLSAALLGALIPPAAAVARDAFVLAPPSPSVGEGVAIATNNLRLALVPVGLAAVGLPRSKVGRLLGDAVVAGTLLVNGALVGAVLGAYGSALLPSLLHLPLEWEAFAAGAAGWGIARDARPAPRDYAHRALLVAALVILAAIVEVYATPRPRG
jgi:hypothetical protein